MATRQAAAGSGAFLGIFARYSDSAGLGYIQCAEVQRQYNNAEAQILKEQYTGLEVGDSVVFKVNLNQSGAPQAVFARRVGELTRQRQRILEVEVPPPARGAVESVQEYLGFVSSFSVDPGFGLISCSQTRQLYGADVYVHRDQFTDMSVGDAVHFRVALNPRGAPVARSVRRVGAEAPQAGQPGAAGGRGRAGATRDRKARRSRSRSMSESMSISQSPGRGGGGGNHGGQPGPPAAAPVAAPPAPPPDGPPPVANGGHEGSNDRRSASRRRRRSPSKSRRRSRSRRSGRGRERRRRSSSSSGRARRERRRSRPRSSRSRSRRR